MAQNPSMMGSEVFGKYIWQRRFYLWEVKKARLLLMCVKVKGNKAPRSNYLGISMIPC